MAKADHKGNPDGLDRGVADGLLAGQKQGVLIGTEEGLIFGYNEGQKRGSEQGKTNGYKSGFEAPTHRQEGVDKGLVQGLKDAQVEALRTDYPRGRKDQRAQQMSQLPTREVTVDNLDIFSVLPAANPGLETNGRPMARPMSLIHNSEFAPNVASPRHLASRTGVCTADLVDVPEFITPDLSRCDFKYTVFNRACQTSFNSAYSEAYTTSYRDQHAKAVVSSCEEARVDAFGKNKGVRYQEGYDASYPIAFAESEVIGAEEARRQGFIDGKRQGFEENISEQRRVFYENGWNDEIQYFNENAVVSLESASFRKVSQGRPDMIVAGDELMLDVKVANFGVKSQRGAVKVRAQALTSGLLVPSEGWVDMVSLPGNSLIHVVNTLKFKVDSRSTRDHVAQLKVTLRNNEGDFYDFVVDVSIKAHVLVEVGTRRWMNHRPEIGSYQNLKIKVINKSQIDAVNDLQIFWSVKGKASKWIRFVQSSPIVVKASLKDPIAPNESRSVSIPYNVVRSYRAVNKKIPIYLRVMSGGNLSGEKTIVITPTQALGGNR